MPKILLNLRRFGLVALLMASLFSFGAFTAISSANAAAIPATADAPAATAGANLTNANCTLSGTTRTCNLWAKTGTLSLPNGVSVPVYGYSDTASGAAQVPGPTIIANQGETVVINLNNTLSQASSLAFPAQNIAPDTSGAAATNGTKTYTFVADQPGTSLYEAGLTANGARQVAMGLYGAFIVRPTSAPKGVYDGTTTFDEEAVLIFSEIDPALNNSATPATFNMTKYAPKYWLINGKAYPNTDSINTVAGHKVLLRYLNAGLYDYSIGTLGLRQIVLGNDGKAVPNYKIVSETIPAGATLDLLTTIPTSATVNTKYALYNGARHLDNSGKLATAAATSQIQFGGMLTFLNVTNGSTGGTTGPTTSTVTANPTSTSGNTAVTISATISSTATVSAAEYFIDSIGVNGTGKSMTLGAGTTNRTATATISTTDLAALSSGTHTIYVHGQDTVWGGTSSTTFTLNKAGPTTTTVTLTPTSTNGTTTLNLSATINGTATIAAAEYFFDNAGADGTGKPLNLGTGTTTRTATISITAADMATLATGNHAVYVHGKDANNNWGAVRSATFVLDKTGPTTSGTLSPAVANGTADVAVNVTGDDTANGGSDVTAAEFFVDNANGTSGTGTALTINGSAAPTVAFTGTLTASRVNALTEGTHTVYVHSKDSLGNWGAFSQISLKVDKTGPSLSNVVIAPSPNNGTLQIDPQNVSIKLSVRAIDTLSNIKTIESFFGTAGTPGTGSVLAPVDGLFNSLTEDGYIWIALSDVSNLASGPYNYSVRAQDEAGNWGPVATATIIIDKNPPAISNLTAGPVAPATTIDQQVQLTITAADPVNGSAAASNIVAAEYFEGTDPGVGKATALTGTFNSPTLTNATATASTATLTVGSHTFSVRVKDAAGNWSAVRTVTFTVQHVLIFSDGFESGNTSLWSQTVINVNNVSVTAAAAMAGSTRGMQVAINNNRPGYVVDTTPNNETKYNARFYFNPNSTNTNNNWQDIFVGRNTAGLTIFRVQYLRNGSTYQIRYGVLVNNSTNNYTYTTVQNITNAAHAIEISWQSTTAANLAANLYIDGSLKATVSGIATNNYRLDEVRLGAITSGNNWTGTEYFDSFVSRRDGTTIGV